MIRELETAELIRTAEDCRSVPVNALLANAIEAHQTIGQKFAAADKRGHDVSRYGLQAILFASTPTADDLRRQIEYLLALPLEAWARSECRGDAGGLAAWDQPMHHVDHERRRPSEEGRG